MKKVRLDKMRRRDHVLEMKDFIQKMMDDTAATLESMRKEVETKVVDYTFVPGRDIIETYDNIIVHVALPGIKKENIELDLTEKYLKVEAKFDTEEEIHGAYVTLTDKKSGVIRRTINLPKKVIPEEASAKFENGILKVEIPKLEKEKRLKVKIE
jgi:HSP20 family protein